MPLVNFGELKDFTAKVGIRQHKKKVNNEY